MASSRFRAGSRVVAASVVTALALVTLAACTSSSKWAVAPGQSGVDPHRKAAAWPVIGSANFPQAGSASWQLVAVNNSAKKIEFGVTVGDSCRTMRGVTVAETATTVTIGAYVTDTTLGRTGLLHCETVLKVGIGIVTLAHPLGSRALLHVPVTER